MVEVACCPRSSRSYRRPSLNRQATASRDVASGHDGVDAQLDERGRGHGHIPEREFLEEAATHRSSIGVAHSFEHDAVDVLFALTLVFATSVNLAEVDVCRNRRLPAALRLDTAGASALGSLHCIRDLSVAAERTPIVTITPAEHPVELDTKEPKAGRQAPQ